MGGFLPFFMDFDSLCAVVNIFPKVKSDAYQGHVLIKECGLVNLFIEENIINIIIYLKKINKFCLDESSTQ